MAISRGAGTEIIRSALFEDIDDSSTTLIMGVQHHIYTVMSIICFAETVQAAGNDLFVSIVGYDCKGGDTAQAMRIFQWPSMVANETWIWNNRIIFNGFEAVNFTGPMDDATKTDAVADQGSGVAQYLRCETTNTGDSIELTISYLDQNNA